MDGSGSVAIPDIVDAPWVVGRLGTTRYFNGSIDDVMIFNRSLSADEALGLYVNSSSKYVGVNFSNLSEGDYDYTAYAQDVAGNLNFSSRSVGVDLTNPSLEFVSPTPGNGSSVNEDYVYVNV